MDIAKNDEVQLKDKEIEQGSVKHDAGAKTNY